MNVIPIGGIWFDDTATSAMGEAFDRACKSFRNCGSAVPEIIANLIIQAAKNGERDADRLYEQVSKNFGTEDVWVPVSIGSLPVHAYASVTHTA